MGQKSANQGRKVLSLKEMLQGLLSLQRSLWAAVFSLCWQELQGFNFLPGSILKLASVWCSTAQQVSGWIGSHPRAAQTGLVMVKLPRGELCNLPCSSYESTAAYPSFSFLVL